jgi:hypothetical protein
LIPEAGEVDLIREVPMLPALALSLLLPAAVPTRALTTAADPPIHVKLSDDYFARGDHARVRVKAAENGYLVVLREDANGRVRVLYPLDPEDDARIRGGKQFEVRSRGDREAFTVDDREGSGIVLAAWSEEPFHFEEFSRNGHWDYRALAADTTGSDSEAALLDLVERMTDGRYKYDIATYTVEDGPSPGSYAGWHSPWYYGSLCYGCAPFYYGPRFGFRLGIGIGHSHFYGRRRW